MRLCQVPTHAIAFSAVVPVYLYHNFINKYILLLLPSVQNDFLLEINICNRDCKKEMFVYELLHIRLFPPNLKISQLEYFSEPTSNYIYIRKNKFNVIQMLHDWPQIINF